MAIAFVTGQKAAAGSAAALGTIAVAYPAPTTAGSLLVVHSGALAAITGVTDDKAGGSNVWHLGIADPGNTTGSSEIWYAWNAGSCQNVTVTFASSTGFRYVTVSEYSGVMTLADPLDKIDSDIHAGTAASSITTPDVSPAIDGELIFICGRDTGAGAATTNAPFTQLSQSGQADVDGYNIQTTATATHGDINNTGDTDWVVQIATFKPPASVTFVPDDDYQIFVPSRVP